MRKLIFIFSALLLTVGASAQGKFEKKEFKSIDGSVLLYNQLDPVNVIKGKKYPVVLFLHGAGERGNDNEKQLTHGSKMFLNPVNQEQYPCYVLFPQCPENSTWAYDKSPKWGTDPWSLPSEFEESKQMKLLVGMINEFLKEHPQANPDRIYVMGLSMGGIGTFEMAIRHPEIVAAACPICGCVNPSRLASAKGVKFSIFHGDSDSVVPTAGSREAYKALKTAGAKVKYTEYIGCDHFSWNNAFSEPDYFSWLFKQHK